MKARKILIILTLSFVVFAGATLAWSAPLQPLLAKDRPVDWWFVYKLNGATFPACGAGADRSCPFGGAVQKYKGSFSQQYVYASSENPSLQKGTGCVGDTLQDPVGATFAQVYKGSSYYVIWNDQFYDDPMKGRGSPWGHSKGMVAWDKTGQGFVMQVSTPSWPASGRKASPRRTDGNSLGCVKDNNVKVGQHFFALKLDKGDLVKVLAALANAGVVTDTANRQIVRNGGPKDVQILVIRLGQKSKGATRTRVALSSGVDLISKPSGLAVPPWQMVSATLGGVDLRTATWWAHPEIGTTTKTTPIACWESTLGASGAVEIALSGNWGGTEIGLDGGPEADANHGKLGVSLEPDHPYVIFGDLNQQGALSGKCDSSQNGRGGTFFVLKNKSLFDTMTDLLKGKTSPPAAE